MSFPRNSEHENSVNTVPKQVLDVVKLANSDMNSGKNLQHHLELDTLSTSTCQTPVPVNSPTQIFSNIEIDGVLICGKQDTGAEVTAMPLNVYDQLNQKLKGNLELKPCGDVKVVGYSKQSVKIIGKISVTTPMLLPLRNVTFSLLILWIPKSFLVFNLQSI